MRFIGFLIAIAMMVVAIGGVGYGLVYGYGALSIQWSSLNDEWRSILFVIAAIVLFAALFVTYVLAHTIRRESHRSTGRVDAYNDFVAWHSMLIGNNQQIPEISTLIPAKNKMVLWGSNRVVQQMNMLHGLLIKGDAEIDAIIEKSGHVFLEIKRELGHRNTMINRQIL